MKQLVKFCLLLAAVSMYACKKVPEVSPIYPIGTIVDLQYEIKDATLATIGKKPLVNPLRIDSIRPAIPYQPTHYKVTDAIGQSWDNITHDYIKIHNGATNPSWFKPN